MMNNMVKKPWWYVLATLGSMMALAPLSFADCMMEGDTIRVTGRVWMDTGDQGKEWMAQLDKPVCVWGVAPESGSTYKISDTVILTRVEPADSKVRASLEAGSFTRAVMEAELAIDRDADAHHKCVLTLNMIREAEAGQLESTVLDRDGNKESWVMKASPALKELMSNPGFSDDTGKNALGFIHPMGVYDGVNSWSVKEAGKVIILKMRLMWKGKLTQKLYATEITWKSSKQGHISAEIAKDDSTLPVTRGKIQKMDDYFRTQVWPVLYNKLN